MGTRLTRQFGISKALLVAKDVHWREGIKQQQQTKSTNLKANVLAELKSCSVVKDLECGRRIHAKVMRSGNGSSTHVASALVNMYAKCGSMMEARQVFDSILQPDVVSWTALLLGYADNGEGLTALDLFSRMKSQGCAPNSRTYVAVLKACTSLALKQDRAECLKRGKQVHLEIGCHIDLWVQGALVDMYAKCGSMVDARQAFDGISHPSVVSWNALLLGYAEAGEGLTTLNLFSMMKYQGCSPNSITYVAALKACASQALEQDATGKAACLEQGKAIHSEAKCHLNIYVQTTLIGMYAKMNSMADAHQVFNTIRSPDVVSWNALLLGYADGGEGLIALDLFSRMKSQGCSPDSRTYVAALKACTSLALKQDDRGRAACLERGKQIHAETGCDSSLYVQSALVEMYAKCGSMAEAHKVFDSIKQPSVVPWNSLLFGYAESGRGLLTLDLFSRMKSQGCSPNSVSYVAALKACTSLALMQDGSRRVECLERAKQIHSEVGCHLNLYVQTTMIDLYSKCGSMSDAHQVFDSIKHPNVASWTALLVGYAENGEGRVALDLFSRMKSQGCKPDSLTFVGVLKACTLLGALENGREVHAEVQHFDAILVTCLVDFYAKCGSLAEAREVFDLHVERRDIRTWTALLAGYSSFGETFSVFKLFDGMQDAGFQPDGVTCQCVLLCCSHAGLVDKARECFEAMPSKYGVTPSIEHYTCIIDVLGRANKLDDAIVLLGQMPCNPDAMTWMTVLGACRKWKNVEMGRLAFQSLISLDETNASAYVLMAHIYASKGMLEEQQTLFRMKEVHNHELLARDSLHPQFEEIQEKMKHMCEVMREHGYTAGSFSNLQSMSDATKEGVVCHHNDNLAVARALINTKSGEAISIVKNGTTCDECHATIAVISLLERRTILLRDATRLHVLKDGRCSCNH